MADELSPQHEQYFRTVFEEFDKNGDNVMAKEQLRLLMAALGENLNENMIDELISQIDQDNSGTVDCQEFLHLMHIIMKRAQPQTEFRKAFSIFDRDGNGSISVSELKQVMSNLEQPLTTSEAQQLFRKINQQEMGLQEFKQLLMTSSL